MSIRSSRARSRISATVCYARSNRRFGCCSPTRSFAPTIWLGRWWMLQSGKQGRSEALFWKTATFVRWAPLISAGRTVAHRQRWTDQSPVRVNDSRLKYWRAPEPESGELVEKEINGGNPTIARDDEI